MRFILKKILKIFAVWVLKKYQPKIIAITGSVGKTSTKEAVFHLLKSSYRVWASQANMNNDLGVPMTILQMIYFGSNPFLWLKNLFKLPGLIFGYAKNYPEILILELAADRPNDIKYLTNFIKPDIGIVTAIGVVPAHVEFFAGPEHIAREKSELVKAVKPEGNVILNFDDDVVYDMKQFTRASALGFGIGEGADVRGTEISVYGINEDTDIALRQAQDVAGMNFKIDYKGSFVPIRLNNVFGKPQIYAVLAAASCGLLLGMNLVKISSAFSDYQVLGGRMNLIPGIKQSWILDDSYNASPQSMHAALDTLKILQAPRKIAVLGDMLEIGKYAESAHRALGDLASQIADQLFVVGDKSVFIAEEAAIKGMLTSNIFQFEDALTCAKKLQEIIKKGDLILIKASHGIHLEKVVEEITANPVEKEEKNYA